MLPDLSTGQPTWLIILCLLLAGGYATGLYFREVKNEFPLYLKYLLAAIRFIAVFLISFMLLSPFVKSVSKEKEKPLILVAADNSQSLLLSTDSSRYKSIFPADLDRLCNQLSQAGELRKYIFADKIVPLDPDDKFADALQYQGKETNISGMLAEMSMLYSNLNAGALILATDGVFNTGSNPVYEAREWSRPIYTIALGDTNVRKDILVATVNYNRIVFKDNKFPVEVVVRGNLSARDRSSVRIFHEGNPLQSQEFIIDKEDYTRSFQFILDAKKSGLQKYMINIEPVNGELSLFNNRKEIFVDVLESKSKILILSLSPHPDVSALVQAINSNLNYELTESLINEFSGNVEDYNLVILHQLPGMDEPADALLKTLKEKNIPVLFILGARSDLVRMNQWKTGISIITGRQVFDEAVPVPNTDFTLFSLTENTSAWIADLPPLIVPFGDYQLANSAKVLLYQRLGSVETSRALLFFSETLDGRTGVISGEGIWKWRLYNYSRTKDHQSFNELVNKTVQYLSLKDQKKRFRIYHPANFRETEPVVMEAEVYNDSYELINENEIEIQIEDENGVQYAYAFNKTGNSYHLEAGSFPPGNYSYRAQTGAGEEILAFNGQFSVSAMDLEALDIVADHHILFQLSEGTGGKMFQPGDLEKLVEDIRGREDIRPVTYARKKFEDLLSQGWLIALIIGLLSIEWFLRKRAGSY